ncbi:hypothetical protein [Sandarakinorhabdus sp. DWP1-3-1]|uniref:hypothetical protein n=1 Tax=Sandarakinorhabdus sp. DWP1-3-1 TaxID=2804627 RepID=UPI003CEA31C6
MTKLISTALAAARLLLAVSATAQQTTNVASAKGASSATLNGSIRGDRDSRYVVNARAGQTLTVDFKPTNASAYINILALGGTGKRCSSVRPAAIFFQGR